MTTTTLTPQDEAAICEQWENGTITIRAASGAVKRHRFSGRKVGKTSCGRYDASDQGGASVMVDDPRYEDCGACAFAERTTGVPIRDR